MKPAGHLKQATGSSWVESIGQTHVPRFRGIWLLVPEHPHHPKASIHPFKGLVSESGCPTCAGGSVRVSVGCDVLPRHLRSRLDPPKTLKDDANGPAKKEWKSETSPSLFMSTTILHRFRRHTALKATSSSLGKRPKRYTNQTPPESI